MQQLYSQRDPSYDQQRLGTSKLTVRTHGCFLCSLATLYQKPVRELLTVRGGILSDGNLISSVIAKYCSGSALPATTAAPKGWCIAQTNKYASLGYPTHFFCVNVETNQQIDPLKFPAVIEPLTFPIVNFRPFTNVKLNVGMPDELGEFPDVPKDAWFAIYARTMISSGIMKGFVDGKWHPEQTITRAEAAKIGVGIALNAEKIVKIYKEQGGQ